MHVDAEAQAPPLICVVVLAERMLGGNQEEMKEVPGGRVAEKMLTRMIGVSAKISVGTVAMNVATTAMTTGKSELPPEVRKKVRRPHIHWSPFNIKNGASLHGRNNCFFSELFWFGKINLQEILSISKSLFLPITIHSC